MSCSAKMMTLLLAVASSPGCSGDFQTRRIEVSSSMFSEPNRTIVSIDSLSIALSESGVTMLTKLPPVTPGILLIRPAATSDPRPPAPSAD